MRTTFAAAISFLLALSLVGSAQAFEQDEDPAQPTSRVLTSATVEERAEGSPTIIRGWVTLVPGQPIPGARVRLIGPDREVIGRSRTSANGQFLILVDRAIPAGSRLVARGGEAADLRPGQIWLQANVDPADTSVLDVNIVSSLFAACAASFDPAGCDARLVEGLDLPRGVDHPQVARDFPVYVDSQQVVDHAAERGISLWRSARQFVSLSQGPITDLRPQTGVARSQADGLVQSSGMAADLAAAVLGGVLSEVSGTFTDKLLVSWGLKSPDTLPGLIEGDVAKLRQQLDAIESNLATVIARQQVELANLSKISQGLSELEYTTLRTGFANQNADLNSIVEYLHFLLEFGDCETASTTPAECSGLPSDSEPSSGAGLTACHDAPAGSSTWAQGVYVQCAYLMNNIAAYVGKYNQQSAATAIAGSGVGSAGLIQWGQVAYLDYVLDSVLTESNQSAVRGVGEYWLNQWTYDVVAWGLAAQQPSLLPNTAAPSVVTSAAQAHANTIRTADSDTTGAYFGREIPAGCPYVYDHGSDRLFGLTTNFSLSAYRMIVPGSTSTNPQSQDDCDVAGIAGQGQMGGWGAGDVAGNPRAASILSPLSTVSSVAALIDRCQGAGLGLRFEFCDTINLVASGGSAGLACLSAPDDPQRTPSVVPLYRQVPNQIYWSGYAPWSQGGIAIRTCADMQAANLAPPFEQRIILCRQGEPFSECASRPYVIYGPVAPRPPRPFNGGPAIGGGTLFSHLPIDSATKGSHITSFVFNERARVSGEVYVPST